eukprot:scaffold2243_cov122-Cylindrotheca_fusiformis.AAC.1
MRESSYTTPHVISIDEPNGEVLNRSTPNEVILFSTCQRNDFEEDPVIMAVQLSSNSPNSWSFMAHDPTWASGIDELSMCSGRRIGQSLESFIGGSCCGCNNSNATSLEDAVI